jgi:hypothetical protein
MTRVLELIVALIIVAVVAVVAGVVMPSSGHVERSLVVGKDFRQVYDVLSNFRRFPEYSLLHATDPQVQFTQSGKAFGPGAEISWTGDAEKAGNGKLSLASENPTFDKIDSTTTQATIVWNLDSNWHGDDKHFTLTLERQGRGGKLTKLTWAYDVSYGWNLVNRYSNLYIHGDPDAFIQFSLNNLQNVLASVPNVDYSSITPYIEQTKPTPVLAVSSSIQRKDGLAALDDAVAKAVTELQAAAKKLGVNVTGPRVVFTTNYGDENYTFDVALPIDASTLTVDGQSHELVARQTPKLDNPADAASAPATAGTAAAPADAAANAPGSSDRFGRLVVDANMRAYLAFGGPALMAPWNGTGAGVPQTRDMLKAYALTHGYKYDDVVNRIYDILAKPAVKNGEEVVSYETYDVYLPLTSAPEQTPEQEAGIKPKSIEDNTAPASSGTAAAPASAGTAASN